MGKIFQNPEIGTTNMGESSPINSSELVITHKQNKMEKLKSGLLAGGTAAILFAGCEAYGAVTDAIPSLEDIDLPAINVEVPDAVLTEIGPSVVLAGIDHESYEVEQDLNIYCHQQISASVGVTGKKDGVELFGVDIGDGVLDKKVFVDFLLCFEQDIKLDVTETIDPITNEVEQVHVTLPALEVTHPRVDHLDLRNCADIDADDTQSEVAEKLQEFEDTPESERNCDDGFKVTRFGGSEHLAEIKDAGYAAAQLATLLGAAPAEMIAQINDQRVINVREMLANNEAYDAATIVVTVAEVGPNTEEDITAILSEFAYGTIDQFSDVTQTVDDEGQDIISVTTFAGEELTILMNFDTTITVNEFDIKGGE